MKNFRKFMAAFALGTAFFALPALALVTYTQTLLVDGVNTWSWVSTDNSVVSPMLLKNGTTTVMTVDPVNGIMVKSSTVANLPTCVAAINGAVRFVTDNNGTTVGGTAVGSSTVQTLVVCYGTGGVWVVG